MEYISPVQLQSYEGIIKQIKLQHNKNSKIEQEIQETSDEIIALKIARSKDRFQKQLCATNVKIFNNVFDIYNLYKEELELQQFLPFAQDTGLKYYLVEIFISKPLIEKVSKFWKLQVNIQNENFNINKVLPLSTKTPLLEVIPVDENIIDCQVSVKLFKHTEQNCLVMHLSKVNIDISYHFESYKEVHDVLTCQEKIVNITTLYNKADDIFKPVYVEYKVNNTVSPQDFVKYLLRNSYHRLDIELFSELTSSAPKAVNIAFAFRNNNRCIIMYDPETKTIKLKCTAEDMFMLKDYIFRNIPATTYDNGRPNIPSMEIARLYQPTSSLEDLKQSYVYYRKLVHQMDL